MGNQTLDYSTLGYVYSLDFPITVNNKTYYAGGVTEQEYLNRKEEKPKDGYRWRWSQDLVKFGLEHDFIVVKGNRLYTKTYTKAKIVKNTTKSSEYIIDYTLRGKKSTSLDFIDNVFSNDNATKDIGKIFGFKAFDYSKPESLIQHIFTISTNENDLVLDSFLGSGTTAAVAHKMNRRWIGIEMGDHVYTHCKPRLDKVISGEDQGGISKSVNWQGGGSYRFMELAPTLVKFDKYDYPFINPDYTDEMLARAMALHENFTYAPSPTVFWKQSYANENTYLFVTTQRITVELLQRIQENMLPEEYLVIACKSFDAQVVGFSSRILVKLIPQSLLEKCEFGDPINAYEQVQQNIARLSQVPTEALDFDQLLADAELAEVEADADVEDVIQEQDEE